MDTGAATLCVEAESVIRTPCCYGSMSADQGCRPAVVADVRRTSLTLAALTFNSHDVELAPSDTLKQRIQSGPLVAPLGATDALVPIDRHDWYSQAAQRPPGAVVAGSLRPARDRRSRP